MNAPDPLERVRASFGQQGPMALPGAEVVQARPGGCVIEVPFRDALTQQERYLHGAVTGAIADTAGGYAAPTLAPPGREVLTAGRRLFVCRAEIFALGEWRGECLRGHAPDGRPLSCEALFGSGGLLKLGRWRSGPVPPGESGA